MAEARVVLITGMPSDVNRQIAAYAAEHFVTTVLSNAATDEEKIEALQGADFLLIHPGDIASQVLRSATNLKLVQLLLVGYELVSLELLRELKIPFAIVGGAFSGMVADHAVMLALAVHRNLIVSHQGVKEGRWYQPLEGKTWYEMEDKVVGIVGMGNIGKQIARRVRGFGCTVQYYSRRPLPAEEGQRLGLSVRSAGMNCSPPPTSCRCTCRSHQRRGTW